jgi:hypothetical protein
MSEPIISRWHNSEEQILIVDFPEDDLHDWDNYHSGMKEATRKLHNKSHPTVMIINAGDTQMPPGNPLIHIRKAMRDVPDSTTGVISVVNDRFAETILRVVSNIIGRNRAVTTATLDDALEEAASTLDTNSKPAGL